MGVSASKRIGQKFGKLIILSTRREGKRTIAEVKCDCGVVKETRVDGLVNGAVLSCGCVGLAKVSILNKSHGMWGTRVYFIWNGIKCRCGIEKGYESITYDTRWDTFDNFFEDMGLPTEEQSIDRIDVTKGYYKDNCRWASDTIQAKNQGKRNKSTAESKYKGVGRDKRGRGNFTWSVTLDYKTVRGSAGQDELKAAKYFNFCTLLLYGDKVQLNDVDHLTLTIEDAFVLYTKVKNKFPEI